jgi:hypothetical protein
VRVWARDRVIEPSRRRKRFGGLALSTSLNSAGPIAKKPSPRLAQKPARSGLSIAQEGARSRPPNPRVRLSRKASGTSNQRRRLPSKVGKVQTARALPIDAAKSLGMTHRRLTWRSALNRCWSAIEHSLELA